jgi:transcription elongation factor Elf1
VLEETSEDDPDCDPDRDIAYYVRERGRLICRVEPGYAVGRKRRKIIKKVVKPFPKLFMCPVCNEVSVAVYREEGSDVARVACGNCGASAEVRWLPAYMPVDAYTEFYDIVTGSRKPAEQHVSQLAEAEGSSEADELGELSSAQAQDQGEAHEASEDRESTSRIQNASR